MIWLLILSAVVLAAWIAAGIEDTRAHRDATTPPARHRRTPSKDR